MSIRITGKVETTEVTATAETMGEYRARMDKLKPHCPKSPDGNHVLSTGKWCTSSK